MELTQDRLRELLHYDPLSGVFTHRVTRGGRAQVGTVAGSRVTSGHVQIKVDRRGYLAHRLAFLYMTGEWPAAEVDHINRVRDDNRWDNLRPATHAQNMVNKQFPCNSTGFRGVVRFGKRFGAAIYVGCDGKKKRIHLGMFATAEEAHQAYLTAARELHGDFLPIGA